MPVAEKAPQLHSFQVPVTNECITNGKRQNSGHCMVAEAVKRQFLKKYKRQAFGVSVDLQTIRFTDRKEGRRYIYLTPPSAQRELVKFDQGLPTAPFTFTLKNDHCQVLPSAYRPLSEKIRRKLRDNARRARLAKAKMHTRTRKARRQHHVTIEGGKAPPKAVLTGTRRQFGLKALGEIA